MYRLHRTYRGRLVVCRCEWHKAVQLHRIWTCGAVLQSCLMLGQQCSSLPAMQNLPYWWHAEATLCLHAGCKGPHRQEAVEGQQEGSGREGQLISLFPFFLQLWCCCAFNQAPRAAEIACLRISIALSLPDRDRRAWARPIRMKSTPVPLKIRTRATKACR